MRYVSENIRSGQGWRPEMGGCRPNCPWRARHAIDGAESSTGLQLPLVFHRAS